MRRPSRLAVDTTGHAHDSVYELDVSSRSSFSTTQSVFKQSTADLQPSIPYTAPEPSPPSPSIRLLFSLLSRRQCLLYLIPAVMASVIAGGVAPFMTFVIGQVFDSFAHFPLTPNPPPEAKSTLLHDIGISCLELVGLAVASFALSSITSALWVWTGEHNVRALRERVYTAVSQKEMAWYDTQMGAEGADASDNSNGPVGAAGLMTKFAKDADDVRTASSLASGMLVQYLTTTITCLVLAFQRSWALTLIILSAVPLLMVIQGFSQRAAGPLLAKERSTSASAATLVDRTISAISTVKAFNASSFEQTTLDKTLKEMNSATKKLNGVWGATSSMAQFVMMGMFVQGFWFGALLVKKGHIQPGDVMAVFWACLIATSNLQMCIPQFITVAKGKFSIVSLLVLAESDSRSSRQSISSTKALRSTNLRRIVPRRCFGEFSLENVTFAYPSRPSVPVIENASIYLPAGEMTFIVGGSGSGKSTISALLLRMYQPQSGSISLDEQDINYLDESWTRKHVASVSQACILFDMSVHANVAIGLAGSGKHPDAATREETVKACTAALIHDFVRDLPDGYETKLGNDGANLSGGQKQRLAIARAYLRDPTVLILDEATSALDPTSRILVFEAIKHWRRGKTTIVITHDLSQITPSDFVYVLRTGQVVEQGFRYDLEAGHGEFRNMLNTQETTGGFLPEKEVHVPDSPHLEQLDVSDDDDVEEPAFNWKHASTVRPSMRPVTLGNWMFEVVADLTRNGEETDDLESRRISRSNPINSLGQEAITTKRHLRKVSSLHIDTIQPPGRVLSTSSRRRSLQFTPTSPTFSDVKSLHRYSGLNEAALKERGEEALSRRRMDQPPRQKWDGKQVSKAEVVKAERSDETIDSQSVSQQPFWSVVKDIYPTMPYKPLIVVGLVLCLCSGAVTPIFSFILSRLMFEVSIGAQNTRIINIFGGIVLGVAALDGLFIGLKYFTMETLAMYWITQIRNIAFRRILAQDKSWFDKRDNATVNIVQTLIKDGDDAKNLLAVVFSQFFVVSAMLGVGLIWAMTQGWQLTLVGLGIAPVFAGTMALQAKLVSRTECRNKVAREIVAKNYYQVISNIRAIRSMGFESVFKDQFMRSADAALAAGVRGGRLEGISYGCASGLIYLAEALLFFVGAVLVANGTYTYLRLISTLNVLIFTISIASQLLAFTQRIAKSLQATRDFNRLLKLSMGSKESRGRVRPSFGGNVVFHDVHFAYPERPDVPVLNGLDLDVTDGECVAIVGSSGSGKSTLAALLQRLYEPDRGLISIGLDNLSNIEVTHLRDNIGVVSQNPHLFDASVRDNIAYGNDSLTDEDIRQAARAANLHDFILSLPQGYGTMLGENASLISGGQAQRLSIARALTRTSRTLILDECTSSLDPENQAAILETIRSAKVGRTTFMITHKIPVMQMCDRILVIHEGRIAEHGTYDDLLDNKGIFSTLASGGEWAGE